MTEKPDEVLYYKKNVEYIKMMLAHVGKYHPGNPEEEILVQRKANIDFAIIYLLDTVFYENNHHFRDRGFIAENLRNHKLEMNITDEDITDSLERSVVRQRLVVRSFPNDLKGWVTKWIYNDNYQQSVPKPTPKEKDPFDNDEFRKKFEEIKKQA
jgi:hypothetical protein